MGAGEKVEAGVGAGAGAWAGEGAGAGETGVARGCCCGDEPPDCLTVEVAPSSWGPGVGAPLAGFFAEALRGAVAAAALSTIGTMASASASRTI